MPVTFAEYIWIDGTEPTAKLRSKTKAIHTNKAPSGPDHLDFFPDWGFDGSSTNQAPGNSSDCALKPVFFVEDPVRLGEEFTFVDGGVSITGRHKHYLVLCEVMNADGTPHESNTRAKLRAILEASPEDAKDCWFGLEQEYTLFKGSSPLGFGHDRRHPPAQGPYYCGVGADEVSGRPLVEEHMAACAKAELKISGVNAEVMPGQWEFQIGPAGPLEVGDHLWIARWLLYRIGESYDVTATLDAKPVPGDWNGAGMHTNFSTPAMRAEGGWDHITAWCEEAGLHIQGHLDAYGDGFEMRLTGKHETCRYDEFKYGTSDRTASIRIPLATKLEGHGYLEDRRPNANADPYEVAAVMLKTAYQLW
jgi:glutamine synthetase